MTRVYTSAQLVDGIMGFGWTSNLDARVFYATFLFAAPNTYRKEAFVVMPDGDRYRFTEDPVTGNFTPPLGRYDLLVRNPDGSFDLTLQRSRMTYHFTTSGWLGSMTDEYGNGTVLTYDTGGRLQRVSDAGTGRYIDVYWGPNGRVSSLQDSTARQVTYGYDAQGYLTSVTDPTNRTTHYSYSPGRFAPLLTQISDNWNRVITTVTYDATDRTATYTDRGETYRYGYGNPTQTTKMDSANNTWQFNVLPSGPVTDRIPPTGSGSGTDHADFAPDGQVALRTDGSGVRTAYSYDASGRVTSVTQDSVGSLATRYDYAYDPAFPDKVTSVTPKNPSTGAVDPNWQAWQYDYYQAGSPAPGALFHVYRVKTAGSTETVSTYTYDAKGRVLTQANALGASTDYGYDAQGNLWTVTAPANNDAGTRPVTTYGYDALGRVTTVTDPLGKVTNYSYDAIGRVKTVTLPKPTPGSTLDFTTTYSYDNLDAGSGLVFTNITDPNGKVTRLGYDQYGRLVRAIDAQSNTTTYAYVKDVLQSITDANGNVTSYQYDVLKRLTGTTFPDNTAETYTYTADGLLRTKTDRRSTTVTFGYDDLKRLSSKSYSTGGALTYTYVGQQLTQVQDTTVVPNETHIFGYDGSYRLASNTQGPRGTIGYTYLPDDRVATTTINGGPTATNAYYPDGSLKTIDWSPLAGQFRYTYTAMGQYQQVAFPNGQTRGYGYDDQGRLLQLTNGLGTTTLASFGYGYDIDAQGVPTMLGQRTSMTETVPSQGLTTALTKYSYDPLYQLARVDYPAVAPFGGESDAWTYDAIGNRLTSMANTTTQTYAYFKNGANPQNGQRLQSDGANTYAYDAAGNQTTRSGPGGSFTFGYDPDNRLTSITGTESATYGYDYQGRRTSKTLGGATATYLYDGLNLIGETSGTGTAYYLYGPGIDEPLAMYKGGALSYFDVDALGSVVATNDTAGSVTHSAVFDAWGTERATTGTRFHPFTYTGREVGEAGQLFYRARYYQPGVGRFTQEDPSIDSAPNNYVYVGNDPISFIDPAGLQRRKLPLESGPPGPSVPFPLPVPVPDNVLPWRPRPTPAPTPTPTPCPEECTLDRPGVWSHSGRVMVCIYRCPFGPAERRYIEIFPLGTRCPDKLTARPHWK